MNCIAVHANIWIAEARQNSLPATTCAAAEAIELAGVDYMTVSPSVLDSLQATATMQGYNDGLSGAVTIQLSVHPAITCWPLARVQHGSNIAPTVTSLVTCAGAAEMDDVIERRLSPDTAAAEEFSQSETATVTQQSFNEGLDQVDVYRPMLDMEFQHLRLLCTGGPADFEFERVAILVWDAGWPGAAEAGRAGAGERSRAPVARPGQHCH
jgi:hypothetical protein